VGYLKSPGKRLILHKYRSGLTDISLIAESSPKESFGQKARDSANYCDLLQSVWINGVCNHLTAC
jgi:hypothetical protein